MKIKRAMMILATTMAITGCTPISTEKITEALGTQEESASDDASVEAEAASTETTEKTTEAEAEAAAVEAAKAVGEPVSDEELSTFTKMFVDDLHGYFGFLWPEYNSPEEIKWDQVIAYRVDGLTEDEGKLPDEEKMELYGTTDIDGFIVETAVKRTEITKFIKEHTGLDITVDAKDVPSWGYNEKYDVFLIGANPWGDDSPLFEGKFVSGTKAGDTYTLKFHPDTENFDDKQPDRVITFEKSGDNLVFKSNKFEKK
ncbi:hypothetical protein [Butyrivibrio sp. M55]|uniref:hypothetical protein n=1 Tax=Butyrivibrio sp. M55 TaxID=1855323 RepID=UPI0008EA7096|nr:hypothetical protein [Butyrivibrio sp. M55]SFU69709.1 hypothetical protein SAMN05216540_10672 [Butyrivibrio sp. M55]